MNGGFHGTVTEIGGQVDPQPRVVSPVPQPLGGARDAVFIAFTNSAPDVYSVTYRLNSRSYVVNWVLNRAKGTVQFEFVNSNRTTTTSLYSGWKSAPALTATTLGVGRATGSEIQLNARGHAGRGYELSTSDDLKHWTTDDYLLLNNAGTTNVPLSTSGVQRFFRVR